MFWLFDMGFWFGFVAELICVSVSGCGLLVSIRSGFGVFDGVLLLRVSRLRIC